MHRYVSTQVYLISSLIINLFYKLNPFCLSVHGCWLLAASYYRFPCVSIYRLHNFVWPWTPTYDAWLTCLLACKDMRDYNMNLINENLLLLILVEDAKWFLAVTARHMYVDQLQGRRVAAIRLWWLWNWIVEVVLIFSWSKMGI